ncbi:MAG: hypothetical protein N2745_02395 [Syntrophorhabdaceae bacterium]|nr:hypothetical protein [Syntrophorhabdaceae bacterium]
MGIIKTYKRHKKKILYIGLTIVFGYLGINIFSYGVTYKPESCLVCHIMQPYYEQWKTSTHNKVGCIECHPYRPGTIFLSTIRYITGAYRLPLRSHVEDTTCTTCHRLESIKVTNYKGVPFNHTEHIKKSKRGKALHCTSCHYSIVQSSTHIDVDKDVCMLCHFYNTPMEYNQNCTICHGDRRKEVKIGEVSFSHELFLKTGARCIECHSQTLKGTGEIPDERCRGCHVQRKVEGRDVTSLHKTHISKKYIDCFECHGRMEHGKETTHLSKAMELSCGDCHTNSHSPAQDIYMGIGARTTKNLPSSMYLSKVRCTGCHTLDKSIQEKESLTKTWESKKRACVFCHREGFDNMAEDWKKSMGILNDNLTKLVQEYGAMIEQKKTSLPAILDSYKKVEHDLKLIKTGRGEHNVRYTYEIGKNIVSTIQEGYKKMGISKKLNITNYLSKPDGYCLFCHNTFRPEKDITIKSMSNLSFNHQMHVEMDIECIKCHNPNLHRAGSLNKTACKECHKENILRGK